MDNNKIINICKGLNGAIGSDIALSVASSEGFWGYNGNRTFPASSIVKVFILGALIKYISEGKLFLCDKVTIKANEYVGGSGIIKYVKYNTIFEIKDLIHLMIIYSDNIATNKLIDKIGLNYIKDFVSGIGALDTNILVPMMPKKSVHGSTPNTTSPNDVIKCYEVLAGIKKPFTEEYLTLCKSIVDFLAQKRKSRWNNKIPLFKYIFKVILKNPLYLPLYIRAILFNENNNRLMKDINDSCVQLSKSGTSNITCHDSGLIYTNDHNYHIVCLMTVCDKANFSKGFLNKPARLTQKAFNEIGVELVK